jgi:superfamily II DNA/RNA helicase
MGRGTDAPNLMVQYDSEPYSSESMFYQAVGRTARNGSKGYYIAHYDLSYLFINKSYQKKKKVLKKLFKKYEVKNKHYDFDVIDRKIERFAAFFGFVFQKYLFNIKFFLSISFEIRKKSV